MLEEGPSRHLAAALRLQPGSAVVLFNGRGGEYRAEIIKLTRKSVTVAVASFDSRDRESTLPVVLGLAVSRGERMDYAIQKCTELGVAEVFPLQTERTEVKLRGDRLQRKREHWQQVAISACEQCGRNRPPRVHPLQNLAGWLGSTTASCRLVLHHRSDSGLAGLPEPGEVALLIGPEGGLAPAEIEAAEAAGFQALTLGPRVLRTETAPVAALSVIQFLWGDMG